MLIALTYSKKERTGIQYSRIDSTAEQIDDKPTKIKEVIHIHALNSTDN